MKTKKTKFYCLQRDLLCENSFAFYDLNADTGENAWAEVEESIATNNSQEWLLTKAEVITLIETLTQGLKLERKLDINDEVMRLERK